MSILITMRAHLSSDPILISLLTDIFASISASSQPGVYQAVVRNALPTLCNSLSNASKDDSWVTSSAIELVTSLANGAPQDQLGEGFFSTLAPCLFSCLDSAEDRDVLQVKFHQEDSRSC